MRAGGGGHGLEPVNIAFHGRGAVVGAVGAVRAVWGGEGSAGWAWSLRAAGVGLEGGGENIAFHGRRGAGERGASASGGGGEGGVGGEGLGMDWSL